MNIMNIIIYMLIMHYGCFLLPRKPSRLLAVHSLGILPNITISNKKQHEIVNDKILEMIFRNDDAY